LGLLIGLAFAQTLNLDILNVFLFFLRIFSRQN
jgi:hypothetical protein